MRIQLFPELSFAFTSQEILYRYLYGGHAVVTLESPSGVSHTYLYEVPANQQFPEDVRFVYAVHAEKSEDSCVEYKKFYLGMIEADVFRITRNSRFNQNSPVVKGAFYIEKLRKSQQFLSRSPMVIRHNGTCARCGSKITSIVSRYRGFGQSCLKQLQMPRFKIDA